MAVPVPHTWIAGDDATSTVMQTLTDALLYLLGSATSGGAKKPFAQLRQSVAQAPATGVWTAINFDLEDVDNDAGHSTVTNTDRYTAATTGWHYVQGGTTWVNNNTGVRGARYTVALAATPTTPVVVNGSEITIPTTAAGAIPCEVAGHGMFVFLNVGDVLRLEGFQNGAATLNTSSATASQQPHLTVMFVSN